MRLAVVVLLLPFVWSPGLQVAHAQTTSTRWFWVQHGAGWRHVQCERLAAMPGVQVYGPLSERTRTSDARSIAATYVQHILPTNLHYFGSPRHMGSVTILLAPLDRATLGYFDQNDLTSPLSAEFDPVHANGGNILYVQLPIHMPDRDKLADVNEAVAHELQHLMDYRERVIDRHLVPEEDWLNEGMSFLAQVANGFWTTRDTLKARAAAATPSWPLSDLSQDATFLRRHARVAYGRAGLFVSYLAAQYGAPFVQAVLTEHATGMQAVDTELRKQSPRLDASTVFANWGLAQYLHGTGTNGYGTALHVQPQPPAWAFPPVSAYPFDSDAASGSKLSLQPWSHQYLRFNAARPGDLRLTVDARPQRIRIAIVLEDSTRVVSRQVHWLRFAGASKRAQYTVSGFGGLYDRVTLIVSGVSSSAQTVGQSPAQVRVRAALINADDDRVARVEPSTGNHFDFAVRKVNYLRQLFPSGTLYTEAARIAAGDTDRP